MQLAGVQCAGNPHFWVNEDGSYQEEGQKNTKGYIWGKVTFFEASFCVSFFKRLLNDMSYRDVHLSTGWDKAVMCFLVTSSAF